MRGFIILSSFIAFSLAKPQYSYNDRNLGLPSNNLGGLSSIPAPVSEQLSPTSNYLPPFGHNDGLNRQESNIRPNEVSTTQKPIITKHFYVHSAPEDTDSIVKTKHLVLGRPQKNYRVVFIKAPSSNNGNVRFTAEYAPQEEKTVIYVLTKKEHELDVNDIATPAPTQPSKPEVFFIKYKTPEEAAHAQREIQAQYDAFGGTSELSDEGTAPISSVEGVLDNKSQAQPTASNAQDGYSYQHNSAPTSSYLPPNSFRF